MFSNKEGHQLDISKTTLSVNETQLTYDISRISIKDIYEK